MNSGQPKTTRGFPETLSMMQPGGGEPPGMRRVLVPGVDLSGAQELYHLVQVWTPGRGGRLGVEKIRDL